jgi:hypothetical protein
LGLGLPPSLLQVQADPDGSLIFALNRRARRIDVTPSRAALNGYQKGTCFYCFALISIEDGSPNLADVDHFIPRVLGPSDQALNLDGVWNLVLACRACNRGPGGKHMRLPDHKYPERLHRRNEWFIESHHPLRETVIRQTRATAVERGRFLRVVYEQARTSLIHTWVPAVEHRAVF